MVSENLVVDIGRKFFLIEEGQECQENSIFSLSLTDFSNSNSFSLRFSSSALTCLIDLAKPKSRAPLGPRFVKA